MAESSFVNTICLNTWYSALIIFNAADVYYDWCEFSELYTKHTFSSMQVENVIATFLLFVSCLSGTLVCWAILLLYGSYILDHLPYICTSHECKKECGVDNFVENEFQFSSLELVFKDIIQSTLFLYYWSLDKKICVDFLTKVFVVCSILAHIKLSVCFVKNCSFGSVVSLIFLGLTLFYFTEIYNVPTC